MKLYLKKVKVEKDKIFQNLNERVDALRHHSSFVICDHQWRPRLPSCGAELSLFLNSADSAGRVEGVGWIFQRSSSPEISRGILTFFNLQRVMPLFEEIPVKFLIQGNIGFNIGQWRRFGPSRVDGSCSC